MKNILILLTVLLAMTALPPSARASLCAQCSGKNFISSVGQCNVCADGVTSSGAFKLCKNCSAKLAQCEACQQDLKPKTAAPPGEEVPATRNKAYPAHWGEAPRIQTKDMRPLPGGYGMGSSTLARWIQKHLDQDAKAPGGPDKRTPDNAEEIRQIEKKIAEMEEFATRARFTPKGYRKHQAAIEALRDRLKKLKDETKPQ